MVILAEVISTEKIAAISTPSLLSRLREHIVTPLHMCGYAEAERAIAGTDFVRLGAIVVCFSPTAVLTCLRTIFLELGLCREWEQ